jgi:hypothetical protein
VFVLQTLFLLLFTWYIYLREEIVRMEETMEHTQNVTLAIPKEVLHKAELLAAKKNISLSELLNQALVALIKRQGDFEQAGQEGLESLRSGFDFGTQGEITWKREDLHER